MSLYVMHFINVDACIMVRQWIYHIYSLNNRTVLMWQWGVYLLCFNIYRLMSKQSEIWIVLCFPRMTLDLCLMNWWNPYQKTIWKLIMCVVWWLFHDVYVLFIIMVARSSYILERKDCYTAYCIVGLQTDVHCKQCSCQHLAE